MSPEEKYEILLEIVQRTAKLNCARPPVGKHYKKDPYCEQCTSCRAREALRRVA